MSKNNFVKGECGQCAGHLEFPAAALGETITCPHCGQPTKLVAAGLTKEIKGLRGRQFGVALAVFILGAAVAAAFFRAKTANAPQSSKTDGVPATGSDVSTSSVVPAILHTNPPVEARTNDFAILPFKLEKTPGSSLVYVTGVIRNLSSRQRFGVKVGFGLFDASTNAVGRATDYQPVLEPQGDWHFKALVMDSKAATAKLDCIVEDQ